MSINITGDALQLTPSIREQIDKKFKKIYQKHDKITEINVTVAVEKQRQIAKANVAVPGKVIHASSEAEHLNGAIDKLVDELVVQLKKHKEKSRNHKS